MSEQMERHISRKRTDLEAKTPLIANLLGIAQRQPLTRKQANELADLRHTLATRQVRQADHIATLEKEVR